jgi:hypothetical protein
MTFASALKFCGRLGEVGTRRQSILVCHTPGALNEAEPLVAVNRGLSSHVNNYIPKFAASEAEWFKAVRCGALPCRNENKSHMRNLVEVPPIAEENMETGPSFDLKAAHRYFAADCFNKAWELIEKKDRTAEENEQMIRLNQASLWHWTQRDDCTNRTMSVGCWQASRIFAVVGRTEEARRYGQLCLQYSDGEPPFYRGYAYEALARAEKVAGNASKAHDYLAEASRVAREVDDPVDQKYLLDDLEALR